MKLVHNNKGSERMKQQLFLDVGKEKIANKCLIKEIKYAHYKTSHFTVNKDNKMQIKKRMGDYFVIEFEAKKLLTKEKTLQKEVERIMNSFLKKYRHNSKVLIVGLGNNTVLADSLGIKVTDNLIATNQYHDFLTLPKIALFNPSVTQKTGINSYKLIEMVVNDIKPDIIIMIDSLATKSSKYLNSAIEISDTGIIPGSALNAAKEINQKTFNIPVIAIGMPLCLEMNKMLYTTATIHEVIDSAVRILSKALNNVFLKS